MVAAIKKFVFNCLPTSMQRNIIFRKKGIEYFKDVRVSDKVTIQYVLPPGSRLWQERLSKKYGHEPLVVQFYEKYLRNDDVIFDIGAQMGYFPSVISAIKPAAKVHCFEGNWFYERYFMRNKELNDKANSWVFNLNFVAKSAGKIEGVKAITLNSYCRKNKCIPTIMQMDVDGEELNVMQGATDLLTNKTTEFLIEVHPADLAKRGIKLETFLSLFTEKDFDIKYLPDFRELDTAWITDYSKVNKNEEFYIYAAPKNRSRF
jgi:hypothetical protein